MGMISYIIMSSIYILYRNDKKIEIKDRFETFSYFIKKLISHTHLQT